MDAPLRHDPRSGDERGAALAGLRELVERTRPVSTADERLLPVLPELEELFAERGLRRGSVIGIGGGLGATSLALAAAAGATRAGSWMACVGGAGTGWAAAHELGVEVDRLVVVRVPDPAWAGVTAALVDAFDVVLCALDRSPSRAEVRRLHARARERGAVLIVLDGPRWAQRSAPRRWAEAPDVTIRVVSSEWAGIGSGSGALGARRLGVEVDGRRGAARARRVELLLPGPGGRPAPVPLAQDRSERPPRDTRRATVTPLRRVG